MPDFAGKWLPDGEGEAAFDELDGFARGFGGGEEDVEVVGHDHVAVEEEAGLVAVAEEGGEEEFGVCGGLEEATA